MIELKNFSIGFGNRYLLENVSACFNNASLSALIGRNGCGKSTLLKAISGLNDHYSGNITVDGVDIKRIPKHKLSHIIAFVNTTRPRIINLRCNEVVALGRAPHTGWMGRMSQKDKDIVFEALNSVGMDDYAERTMDSLSDGESQKIMIARAIAQDTPIIILDEPTSFLDLPTRFELANLLHNLAHTKNKIIIFSTHELDIALEMSDFIALIADKNLYCDTVSGMIESDHIQKLFKFPGEYLQKLLSAIKK